MSRDWGCARGCHALCDSALRSVVGAVGGPVGALRLYGCAAAPAAHELCRSERNNDPPREAGPRLPRLPLATGFEPKATSSHGQSSQEAMRQAWQAVAEPGKERPTYHFDDAGAVLPAMPPLCYHTVRTSERLNGQSQKTWTSRLSPAPLVFLGRLAAMLSVPPTRGHGGGGGFGTLGGWAQLPRVAGSNCRPVPLSAHTLQHLRAGEQHSGVPLLICEQGRLHADPTADIGSRAI
ncbi:hypothetical protein TgHK011_000280 [Trichoderma gracile]|nr:hypothetical protein TgHK011_000280 [Trichoderma gracile]